MWYATGGHLESMPFDLGTDVVHSSSRYNWLAIGSQSLRLLSAGLSPKAPGLARGFPEHASSSDVVPLKEMVNVGYGPESIFSRFLQFSFMCCNHQFQARSFLSNAAPGTSNLHNVLSALSTSDR